MPTCGCMCMCVLAHTCMCPHGHVDVCMCAHVKVNNPAVPLLTRDFSFFHCAKLDYWQNYWVDYWLEVDYWSHFSRHLCMATAHEYAFTSIYQSQTDLPHYQWLNVVVTHSYRAECCWEYFYNFATLTGVEHDYLHSHLLPVQYWTYCCHFATDNSIIDHNLAVSMTIVR